MQERKIARRKYPRAIDPIPIIIFWRRDEERHEAFICDISQTGCFLNTKFNVDMDEHITLEIPTSIASGEVIEFNGIVVSQNREVSGFGVKFDTLGENQQVLLNGLIVQSELQPDDRDKI